MPFLFMFQEQVCASWTYDPETGTPMVPPIDEETESESEDESSATEKPAIDIFQHLNEIRAWFALSGFSGEVNDHVYALENCIIENNAKKRVQSKITDYFATK